MSYPARNQDSMLHQRIFALPSAGNKLRLEPPQALKIIKRAQALGSQAQSAFNNRVIVSRYLIYTFNSQRRGSESSHSCSRCLKSLQGLEDQEVGGASRSGLCTQHILQIPTIAGGNRAGGKQTH